METEQNAESVVVRRSDLEVVLSQISHASGRYGLAVIRLQAALDAEHSGTTPAISTGVVRLELDPADVRILLDFFEELSHVEIHWTKSRTDAAEEAVARLRRALNDGSNDG